MLQKHNNGQAPAGPDGSPGLRTALLRPGIQLVSLSEALDLDQADFVADAHAKTAEFPL